MSTIEGFSALVRQLGCRMTRLSFGESDLCSNGTHSSGMEGTVVLDQPFQHGSPLSAEQLGLKRLGDIVLTPAFRFGGPNTPYWTVNHGDTFLNYLASRLTDPPDGTWRQRWVYSQNDHATGHSCWNKQLTKQRIEIAAPDRMLH